MGSRGPAPTPTRILKARGSWRAKLNPNEMQPKAKPPKPPAELKGEALAEWKRIVKVLKPTKVITEADRSALLMYVQAWAQMQAAHAEVEKDGAVIVLP